MLSDCEQGPRIVSGPSVRVVDCLHFHLITNLSFRQYVTTYLELTNVLYSTSAVYSVYCCVYSFCTLIF